MAQSRLIRSHEMIGWRAWYTKGRVYCSEATSWGELPEDGMLALMIVCEPSTSDIEDRGWAKFVRVYRQSDWYFRWVDPDTGDVIMGGHNDGKPEMEPRYPGVKMKRGRWIADHLWLLVMDEIERVTVDLHGGA